jgi:quercetin dioxygenase-like cupin family protein
MDTEAFENALRRDGYVEIARRASEPNHATQPHAHDFAVRALVLEGDISLTVEGTVTRYAPGEVFVMPAGREHAETVGPEGVTTLSGRLKA